MAKVPVQQGNTVALQPTPAAGFRVADNGGGVMGALAQGLQTAGKAVGDYADEELARQEAHAETVAKDLDNQRSMASTQILTEFGSLQGRDAVDRYPDTLKSLEKLDADTLAQARNGMERRILKSALDRRRVQDFSVISQHSAAQSQIYRRNTSIVRTDQAQKDAVSFASDPVLLETHIKTGLSEIAARGDMDGWGEDITRAKAAEFRSNVYASIVLDRIPVDARAADDFLEAHKDEIDPDQERQLRAALRQPLRERRGEGIIDGLLGTASVTTSTIAAGSPADYDDPLGGKGQGVSSGYGWRRDPTTGKRSFHNGTDIPAAEGTPVFAAAGGKVLAAGFNARSGNFVRIQHDDGSITGYAHLSKLDVKAGQGVTDRFVIGAVGSTGHATGPHLHYTVTKPDGSKADPASVRSSSLVPDNQPRKHDLNVLLASVDRMGLDFDTEQYVKKGLRDRVALDETLQDRREKAAAEEAMNVVDSLADRFTSISQIPPAILGRMSASDRIQLRGQAESRAQADKVPANGDMAITLNLMAIRERDEFSASDLRLYRHMVTPGEFASLAKLQADIRRDPHGPSAIKHERIWGMIDRVATDIGLDERDKKTDKGRRQREQAQRLFSMVQANLRFTTGGKREPTDDEIKAAVDRSTIEVFAPSAGWFGTDHKRVYEMDDAEIGRRMADSDRARATAALRASGMPVTERNIAEVYRRGVAMAGYGK